MFKAPPDRILRFVSDNFELLGDLYRLELREHIIPADQFARMTQFRSEIATQRLFDYKLLRSYGGDYRLTERVAGFLSFLLNEFRPLLPAQINRFYQSLLDLFNLIQSNPDTEGTLLADRLEQLYNEVLRLDDNVSGNTAQLLKETEALKTKKRHLEYRERVRRARHLIEHYVEPLNRILDLQHPQSVASLLQTIQRYANMARLGDYPPHILDRFEQLHRLLYQVNGGLLRQSGIIARELLPFIDRMRRESEVLNGWLYFLEEPMLRPVPDEMPRINISVRGDQVGPDFQLFLQQARPSQERLQLQAGAFSQPTNQPVILFDRRAYQQQLQRAVPLDNFLGWCQKALSNSELPMDLDHFIQLCNLLFDERPTFQIHFHEERIQLSVGTVHLDAPRIELRPKPTA